MAKKVRDLQWLSKEWLELKASEEHVKETRYAIEEEIAALLPGPDEGIQYTEDYGLKISVTRKLTRSIDMESYEEVKDLIPSGLSPVKFKADLDLKKYRAIEAANPDVFKVCQKFISVKPAKAAIKVEEVKDGSGNYEA